MNDYFGSRFFRKDDPHLENFVFKLPSVWWSRGYEYNWAAQFVKKNDIVLDAASGVPHPLKYYLADACSQAHACDLDAKIQSSEATIAEIKREYGEAAVEIYKKCYVGSVRFSLSTVTALPYREKSFDKVFCISVLEHLNDFYNRHPALDFLSLAIESSIFPREIYLSLREFKRVLKNDGKIVLTFDYPRINLKYFDRIVNMLGLCYAGDVSFEKPDDVLYSDEHGLYCYRAMLVKQGVIN